MASHDLILLDTCALLWLASGAKNLSRAALKRIDASPVVYVSAISGFEIAIKVAKGELDLPISPIDWFRKAIDHHRLTYVPLTQDICVADAELPSHHEDPCDRFIIATAIAHNWAVATADERFPKYGIRTFV